jgi:hypothetical protein
MAYGVNAPFGLQPRIHLNGSPWNQQTSTYPIASGYNTSLFTGDPVALAANGTIVKWNAGAIVGVFAGVQYVDASGTLVRFPYWQANTVTFQAQTAEALIIDQDDVLYDIQSNGSQFTNVGGAPQGYGIQLGNLSQNYNLDLSIAGSTRSGLSAAMLANSTGATTADLPVKLIRLTPQVLNQFGAGSLAAPNYNNGLVLINNHAYKGGTGTAGI